MNIATTMNIPSEYDFGISFLFLEKIPSFHVKNKPWFNFHPGPLPEYKGRNLCYHAIMNGEREFGATIHYMDENFDAGDIIWVQKFPILDWYNAEDLNIKTLDIAKKMFIDVFPHILAGKEFERVPNVGGRYYKKEPITDHYDASDAPVAKWIRAVAYKEFYPKLDIHGVTYKVVRE